MGLFGGTTVIGLDIGEAVVKAVAMSKKGRNPSVIGMRTFDARAEGILDERELHNSVATWLTEAGWIHDDITAGLPQYLTTTQVSDFPADVTSGLAEMVDFETRQLSGLSEENFQHDFKVMPPGFGRKNPVLIGICRESVTNEKTKALTDTGLRLVDLGMNGTAVANAFFALHPEQARDKAPQMLLDIGAENSTMLVLAAGQILFVGSLLFGAHKITQALAQQLSISEEEAEKVKLTARLNPDDTQSPLIATIKQLEGELRTAEENWRAQERPELADKGFARIWLSGGGAQLKGLDAVLSRRFGCDVHCLGPMQDGVVAPALTTAYGLALQGIGKGRVGISLIPPDLRWLRTREDRFSYIAAAIILSTVLLGLLLFREHRRIETAKEGVRTRLAELGRCGELVPRIEETRDNIRHHEKMLMPFADRGNRARRILTTVQHLTAVRAPKDWFVYVADEASYHAGKPTDDKPKDDGESRPTRGPGGGGLFGDVAPIEEVVSGSQDKQFRDIIPIEDISRMETLIVTGFTPWVTEDPYGAVRSIVDKLSATDLFDEVDVVPEIERIGREDIVENWYKIFKRMSNGENQRRYRTFTLRLAFEELDVGVIPKKDSEGTK